ncbi:MAG: restriction endonuclease [archaeon]
MLLSQEQKDRVISELRGFKEWLSGKGSNERKEHREHGEEIARLLSKEKLPTLSQTELQKAWESLWASQMWSNKKWYFDNEIIGKNGLDKLLENLKDLLYNESVHLSKRYDNFRKNIQGLGPSAITEMLHFISPENNCLWNDKPKTVLPWLGFDILQPSYFKYPLKNGEAYQECINAIGLVRDVLRENGFPAANFIDADLFFWYLFNKIKQEKPRNENIERKAPVTIQMAAVPDASYIPPILSDVVALSVSEGNPAEFERKVGILFKMLGYKVEQLGAGKGVNPDFIAKGYGSETQYAILVDCKARGSRDYRINTQDSRAILDYSRSFLKEHENRGLETHFLVVSSGFSEQSEQLTKLKLDSGRLKSISLITIENLLFILENKLQSYKIEVETLRELFVSGGEITRERVLEVLPFE